MLGSFVKHGLSQRQAETEAVFQIMAGTDTTVTALRATTLFIATNASVYNKLRAELDAAAAAGHLSQPIATDRECQNLPYLLACIRESLRIWPPSFALLQKIVPPEYVSPPSLLLPRSAIPEVLSIITNPDFLTRGDTANGTFIPGGTKIATCVWGVLRSRSVFGDDADIYRPERWLDSSESQLAKMKRSADLLFGSGRYQCLGRNLALLELRKVLSTVSSCAIHSFPSPRRWLWQSWSFCVWKRVVSAGAPG